MRCKAGKSEPGLTTKVPPVICWILRETPSPCISPATSDFRISRSKVPCKRVVDSEFKRYLLAALDRNNTDPRIEDRKSTRLNSSHSQISYAVFCLKKKKLINR